MERESKAQRSQRATVDLIADWEAEPDLVLHRDGTLGNSMDHSELSCTLACLVQAEADMCCWLGVGVRDGRSVRGS